MGFKSAFKKSIKTVAKTAVSQALAPDGILMATCPQLGVANALVKGVTCGQIDPLSIATNVGKDLIKGQFSGGDMTNAAGELVDVTAGTVKMGVAAFGELKSSLIDDNIAKINNLMQSTDAMVVARANDRASIDKAVDRITATDLAQANLVSQVFHSICKSFVNSYDLMKPGGAIASGMPLASFTQTVLQDPNNWVAPPSYDMYYEDLTDLVRLPLTQTPVSDVSTLINLINNILQKLDDDNAMIEFLATFGYGGEEVVLPNIEGKSPLARACLASLTKSLVYKYMSAWVKGTQRQGSELDFYREIMSEWLGAEITTSHPLYVDMLSSAVMSLKGFMIARYLLENKVPYMANISNTFYHMRYNEVKTNPYDCLQFARNMLLIAQINYTRAIQVAYTAAQKGVVGYHQYSYMMLSLITKLLSDATTFSKTCMTVDQLNYIASTLMSDDLKYVFELCNDDFAWIEVVDVNSLAVSIADAQISAGGIAIGSEEMTIDQIEQGIDSIKAAVESAADNDGTVLLAYRNRMHDAKEDIIERYNMGDIDSDRFSLLTQKVDSAIASLNARC